MGGHAPGAPPLDPPMEQLKLMKQEIMELNFNPLNTPVWRREAIPHHLE